LELRTGGQKIEDIFYPKTRCECMWSYLPQGVFVTQLFGRHEIKFCNKTGFTLNYNKNTTVTLIKTTLMSEAIMLIYSSLYMLYININPYHSLNV
jgi:hypothetical protein